MQFAIIIIYHTPIYRSVIVIQRIKSKSDPNFDCTLRLRDAMRDIALLYTSVPKRHILTFRIYNLSSNNGARGPIETRDVSKLDLHRSQNKQLDSDSRSSVSRYSSGSLLAPRISLSLHPPPPRSRTFIQPCSLFFFSLPLSLFPSSRTRVCMRRVTDLCKLEQKRLLSGYLSAFDAVPATSSFAR